MWVPETVGVYITEHVAVAPVPERSQVPVNEPELFDDIATVPVGVIAVPGEVSVTVTVQVDGLPTVTGVVHTGVTDTSRSVTMMLKTDGLELLE